MTLRVRLTVLYGACFVVAGAGLLGVTYGLFSATDSTSPAFVGISGASLKQVALPLPNQLSSGSGGVISSGSSASAGPSPNGNVSPTRTTVSPSTGAIGSTAASGDVANGTITEVIRDGRVISMTSTQKPGLNHSVPVFLSTLAKQRTADQKSLNALRARADVVIDRQASLSRSKLLLWSGIALGVMALLSIGLGWLIAGRALRPLRTMNQRAREITEDNLHERLGPAPREDELGQLAGTFDELLARLERAFDAQRRFVANASHELRTPLTLERTLVEVALADPDADADELRRTCERVLAASHQQERLIDALLMLARGQAGSATRERLELAELAGEQLEIRQRRIDDAGLALRATLRPAATAGDPALLERLLANLLDNAIVHNVAGGWIEVETATTAGMPVLRVASSGEQIPSERAEDLLEPFRRLHGERTTEAGLGLGLSIVRAIALAHDATLELRALDAGGLEVTIRFSALATAPDPPLVPAQAHA